MLQVKAENMAIFISNEREEINRIWDELFYTQADKNDFMAKVSGMSILVVCSFA